MIEIGELNIHGKLSILHAQRKVMDLALELQFDSIGASRLATAVTVAAREMSRHHSDNLIHVLLKMSNAPELVFRFPRMNTAQFQVLERFFDRFEQFSESGESCVEASRRLPRSDFRPSAELLERQRDLLRQRSQEELLAEIQGKNAELQRHQESLEETVSKRTAELKQNQQLLQLALEGGRMGTWSWVIAKGMNWSAETCRLFGIEPQDFDGTYQAYLERTHSADRETVSRALDPMLLGRQETCSYEQRAVWPDGSLHWVEFRGRMFRDTDGKPLRMAGTIVDIEERKSIEADLVKASEIASAANRAKSEFLSNMSHELRTPLNGVLGYVQILLRDKALAGETKDCLQAIQNCGEHLLTLINDVLDLSKIEAGRMEIRTGPADIHRLLRGVYDIVKQRADAKGLKFELKVAPEVPLGCIADATKLRQVLVNLVGNAVKFTQQGSVVLEARLSNDDALEFSVIDTGMGIPPEKLEAIFQPFLQDEGGFKEGGTGLGLAISKSLVEAMGGALRVTSTVGKGSVFAFTHPLTEVSDESFQKEFQDSSFSDTAFGRIRQPEGHTCTVLIVDDSKANRDILVRLLQDVGIATHTAVDGLQAVKMAKETPFDLILMDIRMPNLNGTDATKEIRSWSTRQPVIFAVTASVFPQSRDAFIQSGFDDLIGKPFRASELFAKIGEHLKLEFESSNENVLTSAGSAAAASVDDGRKEALPLETTQKLRSLAEMGDVMGLQDLVSVIRNPPLAAGKSAALLEKMINNFDFESIARFAGEMDAVKAEEV